MTANIRSAGFLLVSLDSSSLSGFMADCFNWMCIGSTYRFVMNVHCARQLGNLATTNLFIRIHPVSSARLL